MLNVHLLYLYAKCIHDQFHICIRSLECELNEMKCNYHLTWPIYLLDKIHYGLRKINRWSYAIEKYTAIYLTIGTCTLHKPLCHTWISVWCNMSVTACATNWNLKAVCTKCLWLPSHTYTHNIALGLRILTTHTTSWRILHPAKAVALPQYTVLYHCTCVTFYQVLNVCVTPWRWWSTTKHFGEYTVYILYVQIVGLIIEVL
jgi:hypothetical protein